MITKRDKDKKFSMEINFQIHTFPGFDYTTGDGCQDQIEPDIGKDGPGGGDDEYTQVLDLTDFTFGNDIHTQANDHEQVEGGRTDNGTRSQVTSLN